MKKKKHLFPKVSLMSCLLLTAMPLQTAFADMPEISVESIAGTRIGALPILPRIDDDALEEMIETYREKTKNFVTQQIKPFLVNEAQYHLDLDSIKNVVESINRQIASLINEIDSEENGPFGIHSTLKQGIHRIAQYIGYNKFMQDAKHLEDFGKLTIPELDEAFVDLLVNYKTSHRTLVKYENKIEDRAPIEAFIVPLINRLKTINELAYEVNRLPEIHEAFLELQSSNLEERVLEINRVLTPSVAQFIDYSRLEVMMEQEIKPLYLELYLTKQNRQVQLLRDIYPNVDKANKMVEALKGIEDSEVKSKKVRELLEIYTQRSGDLHSPEVQRRVFGQYYELLQGEKEKLQNYLDSDLFDSHIHTDSKGRNKDIKLINREAFTDMIQNARSMLEIKTIQSDLESILKPKSNEDVDSKVDTEKVEKPTDQKKPAEPKKPINQSKPEVSPDHKEGWAKKDGKWFYFEKSGAMATGWKKISNKWYYLEKSGVMATGWKKVSNKWYYLENSGAMATGWKKISNKWYYLENSGAMATGWKKVSNKWYYLENSGAMATGWKKVSNKWYYLENSGVMATGWKKISNKWYYLENSGVMATGWKKVSNKWYYLEKSGMMITGSKTIDGKKYTFKSDGSLK